MDEWVKLTTKQQVKLELMKQYIERGAMVDDIVNCVDVLTQNIFKKDSDVKVLTTDEKTKLIEKFPNHDIDKIIEDLESRYKEIVNPVALIAKTVKDRGDKFLKN